MPDKLDWDNAEDIAIQLADKFPDIDPLTVRFTDLRQWVIGLEDFGGDPAGSNEGKLEAIQMAWHEEYTDRQES
jgi:FeS assembly protein IscX